LSGPALPFPSEVLGEHVSTTLERFSVTSRTRARRSSLRVRLTGCFRASTL
jgi:hypothetical protein